MSRMINTIKSKTATAAIGAMMATGGTCVWSTNPMRNSCTEETLTEKLAKEKIQLVTYTCVHYRYDTQIPYTTHQHTQLNLTKAVQLAKKLEVGVAWDHGQPRKCATWQTLQCRMYINVRKQNW